ncbi:MULTISPECIES: hypothetical protein [unclassified Candidatus Frackibacter]|uniref:hypothetical protein n=1 Tax=unclassified Candidatus Frackibacter TaxID=2648818 RepID=UPI00079C1106|nr:MULTISPECIES: hypothetical protein [unclassified Candidatus Frackibacter]KXS45111.1 MAG: hypothetical protein AWU54_620 [Candidatus Frackibacter sp. T328-2]SDB96263.1 hypothetical protein SAMN04515661_1019 [Candidatus Frackibacter sp. WG11]SEM27693.1 hypothetical protein SAMN04488698_10110 [Candidatus Frackibacter sp. WG12]SFL32462.1 hypothetical protein SAMN04488699_10110 [Candidatus Frackibacter sp. WG13]
MLTDWIDILEKFNIGPTLSLIAIALSVIAAFLSVHETKKSRKAQLRPCLYIIGVDPKVEARSEENDIFIHRPSVNLSMDDSNLDSQRSIAEPLKLFIKNVGSRPALNIRLISFGEVPFDLKGESQFENHWFALAPQESAIFEINLYYQEELDLEDEVPIKFIFQDVDGTSYEAKVTASIKQSSKESKYILRVIRRLPNKRWRNRIFSRIKSR